MKNKLILSLLTISSIVLTSIVNITPANSSPTNEHASTAFYNDSSNIVVFDNYQEMKSYVEKKARLLNVAIPPEPTNYSDDHDIYYEVIAYGDAYYINVGYGLYGDYCEGRTYCHISSWNAVKVYDENHLQIDKDTPVIKYVELENGYKAIYTNGCSPTAMNTCTSYLSWMINGTTYSLSGKLDSNQLIDLANSIYN